MHHSSSLKLREERCHKGEWTRYHVPSWVFTSSLTSPHPQQAFFWSMTAARDLSPLETSYQELPNLASCLAVYLNGTSPSSIWMYKINTLLFRYAAGIPLSAHRVHQTQIFCMCITCVSVFFHSLVKPSSSCPGNGTHSLDSYHSTQNNLKLEGVHSRNTVTSQKVHGVHVPALWCLPSNSTCIVIWWRNIWDCLVLFFCCS